MRSDQFGVVDTSSDERRGVCVSKDVLVGSLSLIGRLVLSVIVVVFH